MFRDHEPTQLEPTAPARTPREKRSAHGFEERLALFVLGVDRARTDELLEGLSAVRRKRAVRFADAARAWDSSIRQGRMAMLFGDQDRGTRRLRALISEAGPLLRAVIIARLAPWQRSLFGKAPVPEAPCSPAMDALACRLIREATR